MPPTLDPTRKSRITASIVPILMEGDQAKLQELFLRLTGDQRYVEPDFEHMWAVQYGIHNEPFALQWHEKKTGQSLNRRGMQFFHPKRDYVSATLDAFRESDSTVIDVKCTVNPQENLMDIVRYYTPQMLVQLECAEADNASLLIMRCGAEPTEVPVFIDRDYAELVWNAVDNFYHCVLSFTPPIPLNFPRIVPPDKWRSIDLDKDDVNWAGDMKILLGHFADTESVHKKHEEIKKAIKQLLPDDVGHLSCALGNVLLCEIKRARNNAVTIKVNQRLRKS